MLKNRGDLCGKIVFRNFSYRDAFHINILSLGYAAYEGFATVQNHIYAYKQNCKFQDVTICHAYESAHFAWPAKK